MELKRYAALLWRWLWLIALCMVLAGAAAYFFNQRQPRIYAAAAVVLLDNTKTTAGSQTTYNDLLTGERLARTYVELFTVEEAMQAVRAELPRQPELLKVSVNPLRDTSLMSVVVESDDREVPALVANRLPEIVGEQQRLRQAERYAATKASLSLELDTLAADISATREALDLLDEDEEEDQAELSRLNATLGLQEKSYETLLQNLASVRLAEAQSSDLLSVVEPAQEPRAPIRPRVLLNTLLAAIMGAAVAVAVAFLVEYLDDTIKRPGDVPALFDVGTLASISQIGKNSQRALVTQHPTRSHEAEAYRILRTNIRFALVDAPLRTLLVTSPGPGEGKSTTAANLAVVMAQSGQRTILIDADLRRPTQHSIFRLPNKGGLTTALVERDSDVEAYLQTTEWEGLRILPSGPVPPNPSELLGSQRMRELLAQLQGQADLVILDTPPLLAFAEGSLLANSVSGTLLVLRAGATTIEAAHRAIGQLQSAQAKLLGTVLNGVQADGKSHYYYYYYHADSEARPRRTLATRMRALLLNLVPMRRG